MKTLVIAIFRLLQPGNLGNAPELNPESAEEEEDLDHLINYWVLALIASGEVDVREVDEQRVMTAAAKLLSKARFWPRPPDLIELIPERPRRVQVEHRPDVKQIIADRDLPVNRAGLERLRLICTGVANGKATNKGIVPNENKRKDGIEREKDRERFA